MTIEEIIAHLEELGGVLVHRPGPGDGSPEISWGDTFVHYAPDGVVPKTAQPFVTIVTKDYPGDETSRLDRPDTFRVSVAAGKESFTHWTCPAPGTPSGPGDPSATDTVMAHPVYGPAGWLAVVNPGPRTATALRDLLTTAHRLARARHERRAATTQP
ncbi:DUF6194 family protein [Streptomyces sp. NPDC088124]|uniref:DUF6194 family protein n=1 Tax=Streptomyces sp. NPDC088124 TaxID=3154654 RepID=UPI0034394AC7